jgi:magnesium transporter
MNDHLITVDGVSHDPTPEAVRGLLAGGTPFWLDLAAPSGEERTAFLRDTFGFHPLAIEDADHFGQRPKTDTYDDFTLMVVFGVNHSGRLVEVHCFYSERFLVTLHQDLCPAIHELAQRLETRGVRGDHVMLLYRVVDALVDGYFPVLAAMDDRIDELEDQILIQPTDAQMGTLFDLKRQLIALRKVVAPQRDMFAQVLTDPEMLPGMTADAERYFRDLYDHLIRISELVDSYRDLLSGALDTHLSTVSNRLNVVMKQLTIIATVFLPATFLTGFFGQNFGWMVGHLGSLGTFLVLGVALQVALATVLLVVFRQRGWLSSSPAPALAAGRPHRAPREYRWRFVLPVPNGAHHGEGAAHSPALVGSEGGIADPTAK